MTQFLDRLRWILGNLFWEGHVKPLTLPCPLINLWMTTHVLNLFEARFGIHFAFGLLLFFLYDGRSNGPRRNKRWKRCWPLIYPIQGYNISKICGDASPTRCCCEEQFNIRIFHFFGLNRGEGHSQFTLWPSHTSPFHCTLKSHAPNARYELL